MSELDAERVSFAESDTRHDEMHSTLESWLNDLAGDVEAAAASDAFQAWLDVQSRFHEYSHRNALLILLQCPSATKVAGYRTWQEEFDRYVSEGESAIWIWAPLISKRCPECDNSPSYHDGADCSYDKTPPEEWEQGVVGYKPVPVFDISQTEGEALPELDTAAQGDATELVDAVQAAASALEVDVSVVPPTEWSHGAADGICTYSDDGVNPAIEVKVTANEADLATTLVHEYAHALLHDPALDTPERTKREVEAEAVAYAIGRYFGLDTSGSALYLAAWASDDTTVLTDRLARISETAETLIETISRHSSSPGR